MMKMFVLLKLMPLFWQGHAQDEDFLIQMGQKNDMVLGSAQDKWEQVGSDIVGEHNRDKSGHAVALSDDGYTVAIGAPGNGAQYAPQEQFNVGHVRVYRLGSSGWAKLGSDIDGDIMGTNAGWSLDISSDGNTVAVGYRGAKNDDTTEVKEGQVRVFRFGSTDWVQLGSNIEGDAHKDIFGGYGLEISGDGNTVVAAGILNDVGGENAGHVRVFRYNSGVWVQLGSDFQGQSENEYLGYSVSISYDGSTVAISAPRHDKTNNVVDAGIVRIYRFGSSEWEQLGSSIEGDAAGDRLGGHPGTAVSISDDGSTVVIASPKHQEGEQIAGYVRVYRFGSGDWVQLGSDIDSGREMNSNSASGYRSVSVSGDGSTVAVGRYYWNYVRVYRFGSSDWVQLGSDIDGQRNNEEFGHCVSMNSDGSSVAIGGRNPSSIGVTRVYRFLQAATTTTTTTTVATTSTTEAPPAGAYGDPHCVNAKGDWFDIHAVGRIPMVILPFGTTIEDGDFAVIATTATPDGWDKCAPTFISAVDVWANQTHDQLRVDAGPAGDLQVKPMIGSTEAYSIKMLSEKVMITFRSVIVSVILNKVPKIDQAPFLYFDMEVAGLQALNAGGILGADPHDFAQVQPDGCSEVPFKHRAVGRYSMARAMP